MQKMVSLFVVSSLALAGGCKSEKKGSAADPAATAGSAVTAQDVVADGAVAGGFPLREGETYFGGKEMVTNLVNWKVADGSIVQLGIVTTGKSANGRHEGVLRAYHVGSDTHDVDQTYSVDPSIEHWAELKLLPNDRVMFRYGEAGEGRRARNAVLLRWDADAQRVVIAKRWAGVTAAEEPEWSMTGAYKVAPEAEGLCIKVIERMVSCADDPKFRTSMFRRDDAAEVAEMQAHFDTHVAKWKTPAEAKAQCQQWASDEYVDTYFSEPAKLRILAGDTKMDCGFFGAEIVDEGGLPVALTDANRKR